MSGSGGHLPPGYERVRIGPVEAVVWSPATGFVSRAIVEDRTVHDWAGGVAGSRTLHGRGKVYSVPAPLPGPDRSERWVVRHYRRGGAIAAPLLHDRYLRAGPTRPLTELRASGAARARGVPTPAVVAGVWYRTGPWYRADLVTELVPGVTLARRLFGAEAPSLSGREAHSPSASEVASQAEREAALEAAGRLVAMLCGAGVRHADLNATNVLLDGGAHAPSPWVVDLDRATIGRRHEASTASAMLGRLERSLSKLGTAFGRPLSPREWSALREGSRTDARPEGEEGGPKSASAGERRG